MAHTGFTLPDDNRTQSSHTGYTRAHWEAVADWLRGALDHQPAPNTGTSFPSPLRVESVTVGAATAGRMGHPGRAACAAFTRWATLPRLAAPAADGVYVAMAALTTAEPMPAARVAGDVVEIAWPDGMVVRVGFAPLSVTAG